MDENDLSKLASQLPDDVGKTKEWTNGKVRFVEFPPGHIALNRELATGLHPELYKKLELQDINDIDLKIAAVATYCGIALDGTYTLEERDRLCFILVGRLEVLRVLPNPQTIILN